jgi:hypothetical protein
MNSARKEERHMGHRANLVVIENRQSALFYCHWCANTVPCDLFWGPAYAIAFARRQCPVDDAGWLDTVWAEGGAVIDVDDTTLLLYGGEALLSDVPLRRVYLALLQHAWQGWMTRWAHRGILDLAEYVGVPRAKVLAPGAQPAQVSTLAPPEESDWVEVIGSVEFEADDLWCFPVAGGLEIYLRSGPPLVDIARTERQVHGLDLAEWSEPFPTGGFHIDVANRRLAYWRAYRVPLVEEIGQAWPGWDVVCLDDKFEIQLTLTRGHPLLAVPEEGRLVADLETMLLREPYGSGLNTLLTSAERERQEGRDVRVNPYALREDPQNVPMETRRQILHAARAAWRLGRPV